MLLKILMSLVIKPFLQVFQPFITCHSLVLLLTLNILHLLASRAQQVPAVSQSAYSPSSSDTGDSMLANSPQTVLTKSVPPANIMGLPPTQPRTKVKKTKPKLKHDGIVTSLYSIVLSVSCKETLPNISRFFPNRVEF